MKSSDKETLNNVNGKATVRWKMSLVCVRVCVCVVGGGGGVGVTFEIQNVIYIVSKMIFTFTTDN